MKKIYKCKECGVTFDKYPILCDFCRGKEFEISVKLSELNNDDMLLVGEDLVISKEDFIKEIKEHTSKEVYTTTEYRASIDARDMLEDAIECESQEMYEDWEYNIWNDITEEDIREIQLILNRIFNRDSNISYRADKRVEIDI